MGEQGYRPPHAVLNGRGRDGTAFVPLATPWCTGISFAMISRSRVVAAVGAVLALAACGIGTTGPATGVGDTSTTLTGTGDNSEPGNLSYWFEYGTSTAYRSSTDQRTVDITAPIPVSELV